MRTAYALRLGVAAYSVLVAAACAPASDDRAEQLSAVSLNKFKRCLNAPPIDLGAGVVTIAGDSSRVGNRPEACGEGPAEYYTFTVGRRSALYVDTLGSSFDTVVGVLADGCDAPARSCADDACGTTQSQLMEILEPGTYHLVVAGRTNRDRGPYLLHLQLFPVPSLPAGEIPKGPFELSGAITRFQGGSLGDCGQGVFTWYWYLSCPSDSGDVSASVSSVGTPYYPALAFVDVDDGTAACCNARDPAGTTCVDGGLGYASIQASDEPEAGMHILEVGATGFAHIPTDGLQFVIAGERP